MRRRASLSIAALALALGLSNAGPSARAAETPVAAELKPFVFLYRPGPAWRAGAPMSKQALGPHLGYMRELQQEGRIYAAGALGAERGMAIVAAADLPEARAMLAADPAVAKGVFAAEVEPFGPRFGGVTPVPLVVD